MKEEKNNLVKKKKAASSEQNHAFREGVLWVCGGEFGGAADETWKPFLCPADPYSLVFQSVESNYLRFFSLFFAAQRHQI